MLVAVTVTVFGKGTLLGARKSPLDETVPFAAPPFTLQVTPVFDVPVIVAMNCWVPLTATIVVEGATETATWPNGVIVTSELADLVGSAALVAVTVTVVGVVTDAGAVKTPLVPMFPTVEFPPGTPATLHRTLVFVVPVTIALKLKEAPAATLAAVGVTEMATCC
jgi:hypothetical protein